jgi:8-oxo-dGTP pyrophosphatase MutT (NUDIX family)
MLDRVHPPAPPDLTLDDFTLRVRRGVGALPGQTAHLAMAPRPRAGWRPGVTPNDAAQAAGLVLVYPIGAALHLPLTVRGRDLSRHAGQVSLPGGRIESGETPEQAALREASEEIGVDPDLVVVLGRLSPLHIPVSGFTLHPVVGVAAARPALRSAHGEVARIVEAPLADLLSPDRVGRRVFERAGVSVEAPFYLAVDVEVWGATAMAIAELAWILARRT